MRQELEIFKQKLFEQAKEKGFTDYEMFYVNGSSFSVKVLDGEIREYKNAGNTGLSFRGTYNGKMGYAFTENISDEIIPFLVENAAQNAEIIEDTDIEDLFGGCDVYPEVSTFDPSLSEFSADDKINLALRLEKAAKEADPRVKAVDYCGLSTSEGEVIIANSLGLNLTNKSNSAYAYAVPRVQEGEQVKQDGDSWSGRDLKQFDPEALGKYSAEYALSFLGAQSVPTGKYKILFKNDAMISLLGTFSGIFNAENVQKGFSLLKGKIGEKIASEAFTLRDDALLEGRLGSTKFDSEGVATKNKVLVEEGVLRTFLHNRKTAKKDGVEPTGNGFKPSFKSAVGISGTNFYIKESDKSYDELVAEMGDGLIITSMAGLHSGANDISGDFSVSADGYLVENGKKIRAVEQVTIAGNFFTLLNDITAVASDIRFESGLGSPAVLVKELSVAGL